jgi:hypothetical protein
MQAKKSVSWTTMVDTHIHAETKQRENASFAHGTDFGGMGGVLGVVERLRKRGRTSIFEFKLHV